MTMVVVVVVVVEDNVIDVDQSSVERSTLKLSRTYTIDRRAAYWTVRVVAFALLMI
jgi:hypothetical protein